MKMKIPKPPADLSDSSKSLWRKLHGEFVFCESQTRLLTEALRSLDRAEQCRAEVNKIGLTVTNRFGELRPHPLLAVERDHRTLFGSLWRKLDLHLPEVD